MSDGNGVSYIFIAVIIVLSVLLATGSSYFMLSRLGGFNQTQPTDNSNGQGEELGPTSEIGEFTVNLSNSRQFIRVNIVFEVSNEAVIEEINRRQPQIRDTIISILRARKAEDISSEGGTPKLRTDIMNKVNNQLIEGKVSNVFFTEFVIQ
jgi:flagellar FliL protein